MDVHTSKTKRTFAEFQENVLHDATAGTMANPLRISGASLAGKIKQAAVCSCVYCPALLCIRFRQLQQSVTCRLCLYYCNTLWWLESFVAHNGSQHDLLQTWHSVSLTSFC